MDSADMREALYDRLVAEIAQVGGRVFWEFTAEGDTEKPLLEIGFTGDVPSVNTTLGQFIGFEVLVLGEETDYMALDAIADDVIAALHEQTFITPDGRYIRPEYRRDSKLDFWTEDLKAAGIRLNFMLPTDFWI